MVRVGPRPEKSRSAARKSPALSSALKKIGRRIAELRAESKLTQEELADASDLDVKHVQDLEHGRSNATVATLLGLARGLDVGLAELFADL